MVSPLTWPIQSTFIAIPVFLVIIGVLGVGVWIGWEIVTTQNTVADNNKEKKWLKDKNPQYAPIRNKAQYFINLIPMVGIDHNDLSFNDYHIIFII